MRKLWILTTSFILIFYSSVSLSLPKGFVYLREIDPTIQQDIRYATSQNFVGRVIDGYLKPECILTLPAAYTLHKIQNELKKSHLSLKVYDCYRPVCAVKDFYTWSQQSEQQKMKASYFPNVAKSQLFALGYVSERSSHSRGSTVDLTIVKYVKKPTLVILKNKLLARNKISAYESYELNMGTHYDFMDSSSHMFNRSAINTQCYSNRLLLRSMMKKYGFAPYNKEWWHFTLKNEPFRHNYFNFPVE